MQNAETVLGVLRERGRRRRPCERTVPASVQPGTVSCWPTGGSTPTTGAMTPGITGETADGMSMAKIERIIDALRHERYRFSPVRRV